MLCLIYFHSTLRRFLKLSVPSQVKYCITSRVYTEKFLSETVMTRAGSGITALGSGIRAQNSKQLYEYRYFGIGERWQLISVKLDDKIKTLKKWNADL